MSPFYREGHHYDVDAETGCWVWLLYTHRGYGRATEGIAHRAVWRSLGHELRDDQHLHHLCRNKACVNPDHLTPIDPSPHIAHHQRMFARETLEEIRALATNPELRVVDIAQRVGLPRTSVQNILNGDRYTEYGIGGTKPTRDCLLCGGAIVGRRRSARFCSVKHRMTYNSRKQTEKRRAAR